MTYQMTSMALGITISAVILLLVRRDHLHGPYALWWIGAAGATILLGAFPRIVDYIARHLGINYPPMLIVVIGLGLLLLKILTMDLERSRQERQIRRLTQHIAILETRIKASQSAGASRQTEHSARQHRPQTED
ncbi:DUF2304 domain-containing protein [Thiorhodococcus mannitoliphagus]|uniref:DUF2304 domain-containing protein n=1 Tax=Thiorhodococcus mannitoliphagus TaxID=329406 RepID=A0A6P1DN26_9GAMM|nr:DUF2304 domain-containing protein [Thiorhodococcus mannitoliphagus]NEX19339.1 DUF2304 domain-containing protein [Thiorhodococcus mannitoliphagus]